MKECPRVCKLTGEVQRLRKEVASLIQRGGMPKFVGLTRAKELFGVNLTWQCQTGQLEGIATKVRGKWLLDVDALTKFIKNGGVN